MDFAVLMPNWNSLDSVRNAHSDLEAAALVFFALLVLFDVLAHLSKSDGRKTALEKIGLIFFAVAVLAEIIAYPYGQRNDTLSEQIIGSLDAKAQSALKKSDSAEGRAEDAENRADIAENKSGNALTRAENAEKSLGGAESEAKSAQAESSSALDLARGARQEADSFENEIASAKEAAAKTEEKLADRTLTDEQVRLIASKLSQYAGQEYNVTAYWESKESLGFANRIHQALQLANWKIVETDKWRGLMGGVIGVFVGYHPEADERTQQAAKELVSVLSQEGIEAQEQVENPKNNPKHNKISLTVGSKR